MKCFPINLLSNMILNKNSLETNYFNSLKALYLHINFSFFFYVSLWLLSPLHEDNEMQLIPSIHINPFPLQLEYKRLLDYTNNCIFLEENNSEKSKEWRHLQEFRFYQALVYKLRQMSIPFWVLFFLSLKLSIIFCSLICLEAKWEFCLIILYFMWHAPTDDMAHSIVGFQTFYEQYLL